MAERVAFSSDGIGLVGELRVPDTGGRRTGLVFTGPLSGVKEQVVGRYAAALVERGFVTLAFDHRSFGESEGEPRQHESAAGRLGEIVWIDTANHIDLYDQDPYVPQAVDEVARWFSRHLGSSE